MGPCGEKKQLNSPTEIESKLALLCEPSHHQVNSNQTVVRPILIHLKTRTPRLVWSGRRTHSTRAWRGLSHAIDPHWLTITSSVLNLQTGNDQSCTDCRLGGSRAQMEGGVAMLPLPFPTPLLWPCLCSSFKAITGSGKSIGNGIFSHR